MTEFFIDSCFLLLPHWISKFTLTLLGLIGYPHRKIPCKSSVNLKLCSIFLQPSPERRIPARSTCSNLSDWFFTDTLQQTTAQQPDFQLHKLVNSSHNKPANVIWGNIDQPNAHPSSVNLQLGRHMLLWQYQLPTNKACSRKIFFFPLSVFPSNLPVLLVCQHFSIWLLGVSWVRGRMHASLAQTQQRPGFLGKVRKTKVMEACSGKIWCKTDVKVMRHAGRSWYAIKMMCGRKLVLENWHFTSFLSVLAVEIHSEWNPKKVTRAFIKIRLSCHGSLYLVCPSVWKLSNEIALPTFLMSYGFQSWAGASCWGPRSRLQRQGSGSLTRRERTSPGTLVSLWKGVNDTENCSNYCQLKACLWVLGELEEKIQTLSSKAISLHIVVCPFCECSTHSWDCTCGHG